MYASETRGERKTDTKRDIETHKEQKPARKRGTEGQRAEDRQCTGNKKEETKDFQGEGKNVLKGEK